VESLLSGLRAPSTLWLQRETRELISRWGTLSLDGVKVLMPSADAIGVLARSVADLELFPKITGIIQNPTPTLHTVPLQLRDLKFAFVKTDQFEPCASNSLKSIWNQAQALLSAAGANVTELDLGEAYQGWMDPDDGRYMKLCKSECSTSLRQELTTGAKQVDPTLAPCIENDVTPEELCKIRDELAMLRMDFDKIARGFDGLITPNAPCEAPHPGGNSWVYFASLWTGLHVPAIHIPGFAGEEDMPMGLTLLGPRYVRI
jgi:amidase